MKRLLALLLTLAMLISALPAAQVSAAPTKSGTLKVLVIGSDLAVDAVEKLPLIFSAEGVTSIELGVASYSGASLRQHLAFAGSNSPVYRFYTNDDAVWSVAQGATLADCITAQAWDVICFEQNVTAAQTNTYGADLTALEEYVDSVKTSAAQYAWHMVWANEAGYPDSSFTAASQTAAYGSIAAAASQVITPRDEIAYFIPSGTAIQNARSSKFGDAMTRNGHNLNDLGKVIAGYAWYSALTGLTPALPGYAIVEDETLSGADCAIVAEAIANAAADPCDFTASNYTAGRTTHYAWRVQNSSTGAQSAVDTIPTIGTNLLWPDGVSRSSIYTVKFSYYYGANGKTNLRTFQMHDTSSYKTDSGTGERLYYGLPSRMIARTNTEIDEESEQEIETLSNVEAANTENLKLDLIQMTPLNTAGLGAVNVSMLYAFAMLSSARNVAFLRAMRVYVSLDGENFLPDWAGVRAVKLLGGGMNESQGSSSMFYTIESENLLDIPGVAGNTIQMIRIMPDGVNTRTFEKFYINSINVYTYPTQEAFELNSPCTLPEKVEVGESNMRNIVVAEAVRYATIPWRTTQTFYTTFGAAKKKPYYNTGRQLIGPTYERDIDSTRELFASGIDSSGYWGANGTGFGPNSSGRNTAYGVDCQSYVWNAVARVSRSYGWGIPYMLNDPDSQLLGDLISEETPYYTDIDVFNLNTEQQMYEAYALLQPGDVIQYYRFETAGSHTRVVKSVNVVRNGGVIDPAASTVTYAHQGSMTSWLDSSYHSLGYQYQMYTPPSGTVYMASSRPDDTSSFSGLYSAKYVPITLKDYATGQIEREDVQIVAGPLSGTSFTDSGVHIGISSNYMLIKFTVTLKDLRNNSSLFTDTVYSMQSRLHSMNYGDENYSAVGLPTRTAVKSSELNSLLTTLPEGRYRLSVAVDSGPLLSTSQSQVPTTTKNFDFTVGGGDSCSNSTHTGKTALTQAYIDGLTVSGASGTTPYCTLPSGNYYLAENVDVDKTIVIASGSTVNLCLNGYTLRGTLAASSSKDYRSHAFINLSGVLNLSDHTGNGKLQVNAGGEITNSSYAPYVVKVSGTLNFYSGNICDSHGRYGVLITDTLASGGAKTINMYGGKIYGNSNVTGWPDGGAISLWSTGTFNMYGGEIYNNGTANGAAVDLYGGKNGTFNMYGGLIRDNNGTNGAVRVMSGTTFRMYGGTIRGNSASGMGGGVYVAGTDSARGVFEMTGGLITNNSATTQGGGVAVGAYGQFDFSGGTIASNSAPSGGGIGVTNANAILTMSGDAALNANSASADSAEAGIGGGGIGVTAGKANLAGGSVSGNSSAYVGGGVSVYEGAVTTGNVVISGNDAATSGGGIFIGSLTENAEVAPTLLMTDGTELSGNTAPSGAAIRAAGANAAMTMAGGTVSGNNGAGGTGTGSGAIYLSGGTAFALTGGTITGNNTASAAVYVIGATLNMSGGTISGNISANHGGGVVLNNSGVLNISGGTITSNSPKLSGKTGRDVYVAGNGATLNMSGGSIGTAGLDTVWFYNGTASNSQYGTFTGGTVRSYVGVGGSAKVDIRILDGNFYSLYTTASRHRGIKVYGGQFQKADALDDPEVSAYPNPQVGTTSNATYKYKTEPGIAPEANMILSSDLSFNMYFPSDAAAWATGCTGFDPETDDPIFVSTYPTHAVVTVNGREQVLDLTLEDSRYKLETPIPIYAKEMASDVTALLMDSENNILRTVTDSVRSYAGRILADENATATEKTLMVDMLNYGAAAQTYFSYNTEDAANALLTEAQSALASSATLAYTESNTTHPLAYHSANLTLEERIDFTMYFWASRIGEDKSYTYTVKNGSTTVASGNGTFSDKLDGTEGYLYEVHISNMNLSAMSRAVISLTYHDKDGNTYTAKDSLANYLYRNDGLAINDLPQTYKINNDGSIQTEGAKSGTDTSDLYAKVMAFAASSAQYAEENTPVVEYEMQEGDVVFIPGSTKVNKQSEAIIMNSATLSAGTKVLVTVPSGVTAADGTTPAAATSNNSSGRFWTINDGAFVRATGVWDTSGSARAYKFGYHDAISATATGTITVKHATGHTGNTSKCAYKFDTACGQTTNYRYRETARKLAVNEDTLIFDLRAAVLAGTESEVTTVAQIKALTDAGTAVINLYVPDGTSVGTSNSGTGSVGGTVAAIIVIDHTPA